MNSKKMFHVVFLLGLMSVAQCAIAASPALKEIAGILTHLEHYPSAADKLKLNAIVDNKSSSKQEQVLASAIINFKHNVASEDKDKLKQLSEDATAPTELKELANMILNINHTPSAADKVKLEKIIK